MGRSKNAEVKLLFGVEEGAEISVGTPEWNRINPVVGSVLEVCLKGSSVGFGTDEWFALVVREVRAPQQERG